MKLSFGDQVEVLGKNENEAWLWVQLADNTQGWIATELVDLQGKITQFIVVESPPSPTAPSDFSITIINNSPWSYITLVFQILDLGITKKVNASASTSFNIPGGLHNFKWSLSGWSYEKSIFIQNDIYWVIEHDTNVCASFP